MTWWLVLAGYQNALIPSGIFFYLVTSWRFMRIRALQKEVEVWVLCVWSRQLQARGKGHDCKWSKLVGSYHLPKNRSLVEPGFAHLVLQVDFWDHVRRCRVNQFTHGAAGWNGELGELSNHWCIRLGTPFWIHKHLFLGLCDTLELYAAGPCYPVVGDIHQNPLISQGQERWD